jgi:hypothetical protein
MLQVSNRCKKKRPPNAATRVSVPLAAQMLSAAAPFVIINWATGCHTGSNGVKEAPEEKTYLPLRNTSYLFMFSITLYWCMGPGGQGL